jgi:hypothetical protein
MGLGKAGAAGKAGGAGRQFPQMLNESESQPGLICSDPSDEYERALMARVEQWTPVPCWNELSQARLADIASREGIDFATALLYCRLRQSPVHGPAIAALDGLTASDPESRSADWRPFVAIVPGGCHEESADSRASLQMVHAEVTQQRLPTEIVPVRSFGLLPEQASLVAEWLDARREAEVIVVSLSKGSAEVKLALKRYPGAFRRVCAWINISGLLYGSEWVRWLLDRTISRWSARVWCWYWRYPFAALEQLRRGPSSLLDFDLTTPAHMQTIHVIGLPLANRLSHPYTRRSFLRLTPLGPNDGMGIMAGDLVRYPGLIYPVWDADHFLRSRGLNVQTFVRRVLQYLADPHSRRLPERAAAIRPGLDTSSAP